jgi:hypothetical protein
MLGILAEVRSSHTQHLEGGSTLESGARGGYDGSKRKKGSKVHAVVDTLGHLLALRVGPADEQDQRAGRRACALGAGGHGRFGGPGLGWRRGFRGGRSSGIRLEVVRHSGAKKGFVLLPRGGRWWSAPSRGRRGFADSPRTRACLTDLAVLVEG